MSQTKSQIQQRLLEIHASMYQLGQEETALRNMLSAITQIEYEQEQANKLVESSNSEVVQPATPAQTTEH